MNNKIVDYEVVSEIVAINLENTIKEKLALGWQPYGNVMMQNTPNGPTYFHQPIVKYKVE
ncbi:DUF1737 domain-containing protein [Tenacibaculum ovolyticum]|uniref:DUF1737 domain-containing protein n=1 Tax=Tenacibaculum ovolyticum TaxID=104270 RepID=UPI001F2D1012|nr:DUF1737 domain-containing protein [Tenacibaculum ovolyticum]